MLRVGLTGGIACGKSHVLRRLAARGLATLDLDRLAHALMAPGGAAHGEVVAAFGPGMLSADGDIDRRALGAVVFADPAARRRLDALVHPRVREEEARRAAAAAESGHPVLVSDAALLVEAGAHLRFDRLVVVHCPPGEQLARLVARDGLDEGAARARIGAQIPIAEKRRYAHVEIDTSGAIAETDAAADALASRLLELAARPRPRDPAPERWAVAAAAGAGPRGLGGALVLEEAAAAGGIELGHLARRLSPPADGPWYRAARPGEGAPWPEALAVAVAGWSARAGMDEDWLASAAASLARLTHGGTADVASAVLAALAARDAGAQGSLDGLAERGSAWESLSSRWGGAPPAPRVRAAVDAARAHPADVRSAAQAAAAAGAEPALAAGLAALVRP